MQQWEARVYYDKPQSAWRDPTPQCCLSNSQTTQFLPETTAQDSKPGSSLTELLLPLLNSTEVSMRYRQQPIKTNNNVKCLNGHDGLPQTTRTKMQLHTTTPLS